MVRLGFRRDTRGTPAGEYVWRELVFTDMEIRRLKDIEGTIDYYMDAMKRAILHDLAKREIIEKRRG